MKLYIANSTKMIQDFVYRLPETPKDKMFSQKIQAGQQMIIHSDRLTSDEAQYIVAQHAHYGLVPVHEVDRTKGYIGLVYSIDKPIKQEVIESAFVHNDEFLTDQSLDIRKIALAATSELAAQHGGRPEGMEVEIIEERTGPTDTRSDGERIRQTIQIAQEGSRTAQRQGTTRDRARH